MFCEQLSEPKYCGLIARGIFLGKPALIVEQRLARMRLQSAQNDVASGQL